MKFSLIFLVVSVFLSPFIFISCEKGDDQLIVETAPLKCKENFQLSFCKNSSWTGYKYELIIDSAGVISVCENAERPEKVRRRTEYKLLPAELDSLRQDLLNLKNVKLGNYGFGSMPTGLPVTFLKYSFSNESDSSYLYIPVENEVPAELTKMLGLIENIRIKYDSQISEK